MNKFFRESSVPPEQLLEEAFSGEIEIPYIDQLVDEGLEYAVPIAFSPATLDQAVWWDFHVQPTIVGMEDRADRFWSWTAILTAIALSQKIKGVETEAVSLLVEGANQRPYPVAMMLLLRDYPMPSGDTDGCFVYFLATMPKQLYAKYELLPLASLGRAVIDGAVVYSWNCGYQAHMGLHAARIKHNRNSHERLYRFYRDTCGMTAVDEGVEIPYRRRNDGRFFYFKRRDAVFFLRNNTRCSTRGKGGDAGFRPSLTDGFSSYDFFDELLQLLDQEVS
ncbi:hypothetical protein [Nitrogeniibacter aestuarii]|uniref:hypothetical protein n=1 Tax=Nitrogeniibacter aestuarii TaxID=2815343 RepID=UPI001E5BE332|nr:hypothetical protein [Nitrogeniibacter aestuarii]